MNEVSAVQETKPLQTRTSHCVIVSIVFGVILSVKAYAGMQDDGELRVYSGMITSILFIITFYCAEVIAKMRLLEIIVCFSNGLVPVLCGSVFYRIYIETSQLSDDVILSIMIDAVFEIALF